MKLLVLAVIVLIVCVVLFIVGIFAPGRSRKIQDSVDEVSKKAERKTGEKAGRVGDMTRDTLGRSRKAADASGRAGRNLNDKFTPDA